MHQRELRTVLLIHAIEETDRAGEVIPLADRTDASRAVIRESSKRAGALPSALLPTQPPHSSMPLSLGTPSQAFLVKRSERLLDRLRARSPAVMHILALAGG